MKYNLTEQQRAFACGLVKDVREGNLPESFTVITYEVGGPEGQIALLERKVGGVRGKQIIKGSVGVLDALAASELLTIRSLEGDRRACTLLGLIYKAVDSGFADEEAPPPISTLAQPHPPEIAMSLDRLRTKYPDPKKLGFLVMRFTAAKPFARIVQIIKETAGKHGLAVVRADEQEFHADLWGNVRTYLHGCGFGVAVYERIDTDEPNANVGLEVGYLMAMNKPVLLLKDKTLEAIQSDLAGKLYKQFDPHDPEGTIPELLNKWLEDNGIVVPKRP